MAFEGKAKNYVTAYIRLSSALDFEKSADNPIDGQLTGVGSACPSK